MRTIVSCTVNGVPLVCLLIVLFAFPAYPQTSRGTVSGTVLDSSAAVIFGGTVELTNPDTGVVRTTSTNSAGIYRLDAVDLGYYKIRISMQGFRAFLYAPFPVEANRTVTIDATLAPSGIETAVEVSGTAEAMLIKDGPLRGGGVSADELIRLPFAYSEPFVAKALPGVIINGGTYFTAGPDFSVNGGRPRGNNFMLDGTDNNDISFGGQAQPFKILDAIQESSVQTGNFGAEFGRAGGGVFNLITKSGTNQYHGTLNWRIRSQVFDSMDNLLKMAAPEGEEPKKPVYTENIYGFTLGGPVIKNRAFFFVAFQRDSNRYTSTSQIRIPTEDAMTKLRALFPNNPRLDLYLNALGSLRGTANPVNIGLGKDPVTSIDRGAIQIAGKYISAPGGNDMPQWNVRMDHNFSEIHRLSFRYIYDSYGYSQQMFPGYYLDNQRRNQNFLASDTYTLSATWTNEFRFAYSRTGWEYAFGSNSIQEIKTIPKLSIPNVSTPGIAPDFPQFQYANKWVFQETQSKLSRRHLFRYGFELVRTLSKVRPAFNERGTLTYRNSSVPSYSAFANFLEDFSGPSGSSSRNFGEAVIYPNQFRQSYFFQDSWKVKPSFALTLGLRYENFGAPANNLKYPAFVGFDPSKFLEPSTVNSDNNNFGPSFGFAWSPKGSSGFLGKLFGQGKTVWRGGFQVSYNPFFDYMLSSIQADAPNSVATQFTSPSSGRGTANFFSTLPTTARPVTLLDQQVSVLDPNIRSPYTERWSFGLQRELPRNIILDLSYIGSASHKLFTNEDFNVRQLNGIREHPDFGIRRIRTSSGNSNYHAMQLRVERRLAKSWFLAGSYTWSRNIDSTSEINAGVQTSFAGFALTSIPANQGGLRVDRGPSDYNRSHVFVLNYAWDIPGPKKGFLAYLAAGWTLAGTTGISTGAPYPVLNGYDRNNDGISVDRPDIGNPNAPLNTRAVISSSCSTGYLNPDTNGCVTPGDVYFVQGTGLPNSKTVGRNTLVAGGTNLSNMSINLLKAFSFKEGKKLEFGLEVYNIFNDPEQQAIPGNSVALPALPSGQPSLFLNKDYTLSAVRTMNARLKVIF